MLLHIHIRTVIELSVHLLVIPTMASEVLSSLYSRVSESMYVLDTLANRCAYITHPSYVFLAYFMADKYI